MLTDESSFTTLTTPVEPNGLAAIEARLADVGFAVLRFDDATAAAALAHRLGPVLNVAEVRVSDPRFYVTSARSVPPHTDDPGARLILWYCRQDSGGDAGANQLVDTRSVIRALPANVVDQLAEIELNCPELGKPGLPGMTRTYPLYQPERRHIFYAPWLCMEPRSHALLAFEAEVLQPAHRRRVLLRPGDALLVDNWRMLHMRDELPEASPRWLSRYWIGAQQRP
jgi:hypothetical protein